MNLDDLSQIEWESVYAQLYAYADHLLKSLHWFRTTPDVYLKGKEAHDYVLEAVTRYLEHPEKFDPTKRTLLGYLKKHIIRSLIAKDVRSKENKTTHDQPINNEIEQSPSQTGLFDHQFNYEKIIEDLKKEIHNDEVAKTIFDGICYGGKKRAAIIEDNQWEDKIFDNGMKRLNKALVNIATKHNLKQNK